jgi:hypothetical protein
MPFILVSVGQQRGVTSAWPKVWANDLGIDSAGYFPCGLPYNRMGHGPDPLVVFSKVLSKPLIWLGSLLMGTFGTPEDPSDLLVTIEAEDKHDFKGRLAEITAPTLVVVGEQDPFYTETLFRETAQGIPNAQLILYPKMRHPAYGKQFARDVLDFLKENGDKLVIAIDPKGGKR